ncbi:MAG: Uma2 family endonuclease [Chloroflexota bacterium]|nr:Uma2 family endonuclease [Chloroflexota bacterium]MDE2948731.1 Uma2 family endonuclease [Chloroflexota bacterium]
MAIQERIISAERFFELMEQPEYLDRVIELVEGELIEMSKPSRLHGIVLANLAAEIVTFVKRSGLGEVNAGDTGFILERAEDGRDTVRGLDIAFVSKGRAPEPPDFILYELGPDLAVEVISPNNKAGDIHLKVMQLLNAGTRLVWLVYPENRTVVAQTAESATTLHEDDTLTGGDVLPGFELRVGDIFPS